MIPRGFCFNAYYAIYPYLLAGLYGAKFAPDVYGEGLTIRCICEKNAASIKIVFKFKRFKPVLNLIEKVSRMLGFPKDAIDRTVELEVEESARQCSLSKGAVFAIKTPNSDEFCPASFFSAYPLLYAYLKSDYRYYRASKRGFGFLCPDPKNNINYNVAFDRETAPDGDIG